MLVSKIVIQRIFTRFTFQRLWAILNDSRNVIKALLWNLIAFYKHHKNASGLHCSFLREKKISFLHFFFLQAQNDTELSFDKNERLEIIDKPPSDPDWYKARNTAGQIGLVPKNYLIELSQYLTQDVNKGSNGSASANNGHVNHINQEEIKSQPWYFGTISRAECDSLLSEKGMDGDFMIRESETNVSKPSTIIFR